VKKGFSEHCIQCCFFLADFSLLNNNKETHLTVEALTKISRNEFFCNAILELKIPKCSEQKTLIPGTLKAKP